MTTDKTPTDAEIAALYADETGFALGASHGQAPASVLHLVHSAFAEIAMAFPKAFALHKVGIADTAVRKALAAYTPQAADSVPAVSDLPPLPAPDLRDVGTKPQEIKEFLKGYATEYARTTIAARAPADSVLEDAARYRWLRRGQHWSVIDGIGNDLRAEALDAAVDAARKQGATQ